MVLYVLYSSMVEMSKSAFNKSADMVKLTKIWVLDQKVFVQGVLSDKTCQLDSAKNMEKKTEKSSQKSKSDS